MLPSSRRLGRAGGYRGIHVVAGQAHKTIALQLDEERICGFHFLNGSGLLYYNRGWLLNHNLVFSAGVRVIPPESVAPERGEEAVVVKTMMTKTANNAGPSRSESNTAPSTESAMANGTTHVGTTGYTHAAGRKLRQKRGRYS